MTVKTDHISIGVDLSAFHEIIERITPIAKAGKLTPELIAALRRESEDRSRFVTTTFGGMTVEYWPSARLLKALIECEEKWQNSHTSKG